MPMVLLRDTDGLFNEYEKPTTDRLPALGVFGGWVRYQNPIPDFYIK